MKTPARTRRTRILGAAGAGLLVAGVASIVIAVRAQESAPQPPRSAASAVNVIPSTPDRTSAADPATSRATAGTPTGSATAHRSAGSTTRGLILPRSAPLQLKVPAIGVDTSLRTIGLTSGGAIQTPPLVRDSHAYWLTVSPTPGQLGPATIIGHVDSAAYGPGVFFKLGALRQRDKIYVTRADHTVAMFEVERVVEYSKARFPTKAVYGNIDHAGLRLITCGGTFDSSIGSYESNIVVYAALVSESRA